MTDPIVPMVDDPFAPGRLVRASLAKVHPSNRFEAAVQAGFDRQEQPQEAQR